MAIPQESIVTNNAYFQSFTATIDSVESCADLQKLATNFQTSVNGTINAITDEIALVNTQITDLVPMIANMESSIAELSATSGVTSIMATLQSASLLANDVGTLSAYVKLQASELVSASALDTAAFAAQVTSLTSQVTKFTNDIDLLYKKLNTIQSQLTSIASGSASVMAKITNAALEFPSCPIPIIPA